MSEADDITIELRHLQQKLQNYLQTHWRLFLAEGLFFIFLGLCAIVIPQLFTMATVIALGWILVFGGIVQASRVIAMSSIPGFGWWLFMGILQVFIGYLFITRPIAGALTLTMLMTVFFALEGIAKTFLALMMRPLANWGFILFSGVTALVFSLIIWISWSETAHWLLGVFLGVNMVFLGWSLIKISLHHKAN